MRRYRIDNDAEPVREIQRYLLEVAHVDDHRRALWRYDP